jgi:4-alpha-glucanotransferase
LPGNYEAGDFGPEAYRFAEFLKKAGQTYWQILPLNQTDARSGYSPYSPLSAFAGNTMFINPDILVEHKLLKKNVFEGSAGSSGKTKYAFAEQIKQQILESAYSDFKSSADNSLREEFTDFCVKEEFWLHDYTLFITLRNYYGHESWNTWHYKYRMRERDALEEFSEKHGEAIEAEKYAQFLFLKQWKALKTYCNEKGIRIIGDIPIYIGYESADVWSHPEYFKLKKNREMLKVAGVPPDYFNDEGQLWNMPTYDWKTLKEHRYDWWIQRLKKNTELFDFVRIDHFRGLSSYWEVNALEENAVNGRWLKGPGTDFLDTVRKKFPSMPFIAEDLGDVDQAVYDLRDKYELPGMHVVQFGFGKDMARSVHAPHNYTNNSVVYTGTHDNNTTKGWYKQETGRKIRKNLKKFASREIKEGNCHKVLMRIAYRSVAKTAIIPMQDVLGLGPKYRMNLPATKKGNWLWRSKKSQLNKKVAKFLLKETKRFNRL